MYIYVFATFSFDTVFRVSASLFSVTSLKGVSSFAVIIALVLPVWGVPNPKNLPASGAVCAELCFSIATASHRSQPR